MESALEFLTASQNLIFVVALGLLFFIGVLEGVGMMMGLGLSSVLEGLMPELDLPDLDVDVGADVDLDVDAGFNAQGVPGGVFTNLLGWLRVGRVPVLMLFIVFLASFGSIGLFIQSVSDTVTGGLLPGWLVFLPAAFLSFPVVRVVGGWIARLVPDEETTAVSEDSLLGLVAVLGNATGRRGMAAESEVVDEHGRTHYVLVEPMHDGEKLAPGGQVELVERHGEIFYAESVGNEGE